jgi:hypothetical protein
MSDGQNGKSLIPDKAAQANAAAAADYALKRRAHSIEVVRLGIKVTELMTFVQDVALNARRRIGPRTGLRLRAAEIALRKILPDVQQVEFRGLMTFAPISARQAALANLSDEQLALAIKVAEMIRAAEPEPIDGQATRVPEETEE